ncbi:MAG: hypothetical protein HKN15_12685 [Xanthomonadales bacterium]|nr:hypothetical protein [Xanthomonadales bacterium]
MNNPKDDAEFDPFANHPESTEKQGSGNGVAWLALVLVLALLGFNAWDWWSMRLQEGDASEQAQVVDSVSRRQAGLENTLSRVQQQIAELEQQDAGSDLAALRAGQQALQSRASALGVADADRQAQIDAVNTSMLALLGRIEALESSVAALAVRDDGAGKSLDIAEVDYLLRLADERLALFGDLRSAESALVMADRQLQAIDDPLYAPVRRSISNALESLRSAPRIDIVAVGQRLANLQSNLGQLPFPGEAPTISDTVDSGETGTWARIKAALAPLVKVRRRVDESELLSLEDKDFVRQGLWLQLETARLALVRNDQASWDYALARAGDTLRDRFDNIEPRVQQAAATVDELAELGLAPELPDVRAPWSQLRLLRDSRVSTAVPGTAVEPQSAEQEDEIEPGDEGGQ